MHIREYTKTYHKNAERICLVVKSSAWKYADVENGKNIQTRTEKGGGSNSDKEFEEKKKQIIDIWTRYGSG